MRPARTFRAAALLAILLAGCGVQPPSGSGHAPTAVGQASAYPEADPAVLAAWDRFPAWLFTAPGAVEPLAWPAVAEAAFWPRGPNALVMGGGARLGADGTTLTVTLPAPGPVCPGEQLLRYEPAVLESGSAVVVGLHAVPDGVQPGTPQPDCAVTSVGRVADHTVRLASPLGGRVLLAPVGVGYSEVLAVVPG